MTVLLEAEGLSIELGGRMLLRDVTLRLHAGEVLVLVGPNGAGKSTLLGALIGDVAPAAGRVSLLGLALDAIPPRERARLRGVLLQHNDVSFPFTVEEVVEMGRAPWRGHDREGDDAAIVSAALVDAQVAHLAERPTSRLSGGERARAALARTLAQATPVLVLDEPTAALDVRHQERVLRRARAHADAGGAALIVLHDLNLAAAHADRIAVLHDGRMRVCDVPERALDAAMLSDVYGHPVRVITPFPGEPPLVVPQRGIDRIELVDEVAASVSGATRHPSPHSVSPPQEEVSR